MLGFASLPISFWRYALEIVYYILNKVSSKSVNKTLHEIWIGCKPMLSHLRVWGCPAYVKHLKTDKFGPKSDKYLFIGYLKKTKGYYFYFVEEQKMFVRNRTVFLEKKFLREGTNACKIEFGEVQEMEGPTYIESDLIEESNLEPVEAPLTRFGRVLR